MKSYSLLIATRRYGGRRLLIREGARTDDSLYYTFNIYNRIYFRSEYKDLKVKEILLTRKEKRSKLWKKIGGLLKSLCGPLIIIFTILMTFASVISLLVSL